MVSTIRPPANGTKKPIRNIWMVTPEIPPLRTTGGLADAVRGLSGSLAGIGRHMHVCVFVPSFAGAYERAAEYAQSKGRRFIPSPLPKLKINLGQISLNATTTAATMPISEKKDDGFLRYFFIDSENNEFFGTFNEVYDSKNEALRYLFFNKVIVELYKQARSPSHPGWKALPRLRPHVIHTHDWGTGYIGYFLRHYESNLRMVPLVYNIHNLGYSVPLTLEKFFLFTGEINPWVYSTEGMEFFGKIDPHKAAITFADRTVVVSGTYENEILFGQTPPPANLYAGILQRYQDRLRGILNGIPDDFGPALFYEKGVIPENYDADKLEGRIAAQRLLQDVTGLDRNGKFILVSSGRWAEQKGTDILLGLLPNLLHHYENLQFVTIGTEAPGQNTFSEQFKELKAKYPGRVAIIPFDSEVKGLSGENMEALAMAGGDAYLMPSRYEPCGLGQMKALKMGMPVIANRTGGLADTIKSGRTGILFDGVYPQNILSAVVAAEKIFTGNPEKWNQMRIAGMQQDFSWSSAAENYINLYEEIIEFWARQ